jgi:transcriptional regulator with PAS, ATPase and Fis domain
MEQGYALEGGPGRASRMSKPSDAGDEVRTTPELAARLGRRRLLAFWEGGTAALVLTPEGVFTVGRGEGCSLRIDHTSVSREHARVTVGESVRIEDVGSANGIRVRGTRIAPQTPSPIAAGDVVELGAAVLVLQEPLVEEATAPKPAVGTNDPMRATERLVDLVSKSDITVLLLGETGAGKNVLAERIHRGSLRAAAPLVAINCAALPEPLLEAELFGFERGAFTGATQSKAGLLESAEGGTALLDEIGEMPLATQAKLLAVVESRRVTRLGSVTPRRIDVRFLAATNRDLVALVARGQFRDDLYFRLNGITIQVPPLRLRKSEIARYAKAFLLEAAERASRTPPRLSDDALARLEAHLWPGNLRELRNTIERAVVLSAGSEVLPEHLQLASAAPAPAAAPSVTKVSSLRDDVDALERQRVVEALDAHAGNQTHAAKALGISRSALIARIEAFGLARPRKR